MKLAKGGVNTRGVSWRKSSRNGEAAYQRGAGRGQGPPSAGQALRSGQEQTRIAENIININQTKEAIGSLENSISRGHRHAGT